MGRIVVTEFVSMDGVMQAPGGEDFKYKGWTFDYDRGEDGNKFKYDEVAGADAHLLGRVTYDTFAGAWPEREKAEGELGEFAKMFGEAPKYVVSSTLEDPEWRNTTVIDGGGDVPAEVAKLKERHENILVSGSRTLVQTLLKNELVDEVRLMVFPTVLGTGDKVFGDYPDRSTWKLTEANPVGSEGVLTVTYERA